ncbi:unnamed protein product [Rhizophagus irregularis]|nr:unnamed protein product [Rhizophagus irregularis]
MQQENSKPVLYQGKAFTTWKQAFETIENHRVTYLSSRRGPITTLHDIHSHNLNPNIIQFGDNKYIPSEIMKEIEFLTIKCRMGAATQRQYFEAKFPEQIIYDNDLYKAIQHFRSQNKDDSNDTAKLYMKLLELSQNNPM